MAKASVKVKSIDGIIRPVKNRRSFFLRKKVLLPLSFFTLLVLITVGMVYSMKQNNGNLNNLSVVKRKVSKHILLPSSEQPALATVLDKSKLNRTIFKGVENGDKILIYQNNKKMIIYRPSIDKIVDIRTVAIDNPGGTSL